ncbi:MULTISPECIES: hypothetical protein [Paenibacillus]|uniref:Transcriptional regulator n=1 Tax=Paenibacillus urinalis TaxID=521520 RepID=A0AAX3N3U0_9BACL|nr:hypothetical protein [Paenibacillus urinalis]WDH83339.1 hypothetical protein PUW23_03585 [Paenibacillus urinalis]
MYGHQFYQFPNSIRVEYLNKELQSGRYDTLEELAAEIFIDIEDLKEELRVGGYYFVHELNRFVKIEVEQVG